MERIKPNRNNQLDFLGVFCIVVLVITMELFVVLAGTVLYSIGTSHMIDGVAMAVHRFNRKGSLNNGKRNDKCHHPGL